MSTEENEITIETYDKHIIKVPKHIAEQSTLINMMIEDMVDSSIIVPLANKACTLSTIELVIKYLKKHTEFEKEKADDNVVTAFDNEFENQPDEIIFNIILAANFLDVKNLLELMCKKLANELKKCITVEDVRNRFDIRQEITPADVDEVKKAHSWIHKDNDSI
jgi:S-phase kinase-associated protein 1